MFFSLALLFHFQRYFMQKHVATFMTICYFCITVKQAKLKFFPLFQALFEYQMASYLLILEAYISNPINFITVAFHSFILLTWQGLF